MLWGLWFQCFVTMERTHCVNYRTLMVCLWTMEPLGCISGLWNPEDLCLLTMKPDGLWTMKP